jgi:oligosaccharide repeat unit polymerase
MTESLFFASAIDTVVFLICAYLLLRHAKLSIYHPATTYLVFHAFAFTSRLIFLNWETTLFLGTLSDYFTEIENHEIVRATILADVGFACMTFAWIREARREPKINSSSSSILLDDNILKVVLFITIPIGIWAIFAQLYIPGIGKPQNDFGIWAESSYITNTQNWLILSCLVLIFKYGFKTPILIILILSLIILSFQGELRYRIVTPCIFLLFLYLHRQKKRWLSLRFTIYLIIGFLVFLPLKYIGKLVQQGANFEDLIEFASEYRESLRIGANADFSFLDMYASILTLIDQHGKYYYGSTYLNLLINPIPRPFWAEKPSMMQWMTDISTPTRNLKQLGATATIYGESFVNFGFLGVVFIPFLFAKYSARWYFKSLNAHPQSANLYLYLYFSTITVLVYRDGLNAIFMFLTTYNMPGFFVYIFSVFKRIKL